MKQLLVLLVLLGAPRLLLADYVFGNCRQPARKLYAIRDISGADKMMVCENCYGQVPRCHVCGVPLKPGESANLDDGRHVCNDDYRAGISKPEDLEEIFQQTRQELERTFYRFSMVFPATNVTVSLV